MTLFLDIDGVLSTNESMLKSYGKLKYRGFLEKYGYILNNKILDHVMMLDISLCNSLTLDLHRYDNIVIHSCWNKVLDIDELKLVFLVKGFPTIADMITDVLKLDHSKSRIENIEQYAKEHGIEKFKTMDDQLLDYDKNTLPLLLAIALHKDGDLDELLELEYIENNKDD